MQFIIINSKNYKDSLDNNENSSSQFSGNQEKISVTNNLYSDKRASLS
jgi:hypothetical protein